MTSDWWANIEMKAVSRYSGMVSGVLCVTQAMVRIYQMLSACIWDTVVGLYGQYRSMGCWHCLQSFPLAIISDSALQVTHFSSVEGTVTEVTATIKAT